MEKMRMESTVMNKYIIEKLEEIFPACITEGRDSDDNITKKINFDAFRQMFSDVILEGEECFEFTWAGKRAAMAEANRPVRMTLRPVMNESVNWDSTENIYIEGDNLDVLKLLQESYLNKIRMIYIDPPYNTGSDLIYQDDLSRTVSEYEEELDIIDENGNRLFRNTDGNGRFHSDWCSMIYSRLLLARNLLTDDGIIFISIDDNEVENLREICNEVFGGSNEVTPFIWPLPRGINAGLIARAHEYVLVYCKDINLRKNFNRITNDVDYSVERCNKKIDSRHPETTISFPAGVPYEGPDKVIEGVIEGSEQINIIGKMVFKDGKLAEPVTLSAGWTMKNMIMDWLAGKDVYDLKGQKIEGFFFKENGRLYSKKIMSTLSIKSVLKDIPDTQMARKEMEELFGSQDVFSYPKTIELVRLFAKLATDDGDTIMDFFSGSATSAHAIMKLNVEDDTKRKYIMVQLPESVSEDSAAAKMGLKNICEIGKERIRRAGQKIKEANPLLVDGLDIGFRVFKLDDSNMNDVYYSAGEYTQDLLNMLESNVKPDRTDMDLLFGCLLEWGLPLSMPYTSEKIDGFTVHTYNDGDLVACFDENISDTVVKAIARRQPLRAVFRDSSFDGSPAKINVGEIFKMIAPDTRVKVI